MADPQVSQCQWTLFQVILLQEPSGILGSHLVGPTSEVSCTAFTINGCYVMFVCTMHFDMVSSIGAKRKLSNEITGVRWVSGAVRVKSYMQESLDRDLFAQHLVLLY